MRDHKQGFINLHLKQPQDTSSKSENQVKDVTHPNSTNNQTATSATKVTEEAIDVLSLMGFKL